MWMFIRYHSNRKHRNRASLCGIIRKFKYALTEATQSFFFLLSNTLPVLFYFVYDVSSRTQTNVFQKSWSQRTRQKAKGSVECLTGGSYSPTFNLTTHTEKGTLSTELARNAAQRVEIFDSQEVPPPCRDILPRWLKREDQQSYWSHSGSSVWSAEDNEELKIKKNRKWRKMWKRSRNVWAQTCSSRSLFGNKANHSSRKWTRPDWVSFKVNHCTDIHRYAVKKKPDIFFDYCVCGGIFLLTSSTTMDFFTMPKSSLALGKGGGKQC